MERTKLRAVLARNVRRLRKMAWHSQAARSDRCGLHRSYISDIERSARNVSLSVLERLAEALGISAAELLGRKTDLIAFAPLQHGGQE